MANVDYAFLQELITKANSFEKLANFFALTDEQKMDPKASDWLIDRIKQLQTSYFLRKGKVDNVDFEKATKTPEE